MVSMTLGCNAWVVFRRAGSDISVIRNFYFGNLFLKFLDSHVPRGDFLQRFLHQVGNKNRSKREGVLNGNNQTDLLQVLVFFSGLRTLRYINIFIYVIQWLLLTS